MHPGGLGRRRRRLYWTTAALIVMAAATTAVGVAIHRISQTEPYRPGENHAEITQGLSRARPATAPRPRFIDVTEAAGLGRYRAFLGPRSSQLPEDMGPGVAWGDYDGDGDDDLFAVAAGAALGRARDEWAPSMLYENRGDGTFREVRELTDLRIIGMGAAWGDYDGDGWQDLVVTGFGELVLFHNDRGRLVRTNAFGDLEGFWSGASWADYDRDGDLDLYVCGYVRYDAAESGSSADSRQYGRAVPFTLNPASFRPERNLLLRNEGDDGFVDVAAELGVDNLAGRSLGALWQDLDGDGWPDLYVANDISDNALYRNLGGAGFEDISHSAYVADYRGAMGLAAGDWNGDGDVDLFVSHWIAQENALYDSLRADLAQRDEAPAGLRFMDVADQVGLGQIALQFVGWGAEFADFDADGWLDLFVANGSTFESAADEARLEPQASFLFWNDGGRYFYEIGALEPAISTPHVSRGAAVADFDRDGDLDLVVADRDLGLRLLRNEMQTGNWLEVRLRPGFENTESRSVVEGSIVRVALASRTLQRSLSSASYLSQSSATLHFGLGDAARVEMLEVLWPDGASERFEQIAVNAFVEITRDGTSPSRIEITGPAHDAQSRALDRERIKEFWETQRAAMHAMKVDRDYEAAIVLFRDALRLNPDHADSIYYLANSFAETGAHQEALGQLEALRRVDPMSHRALKRWGILRAGTASSAEELKAAAQALRQAVQINPEETGALQALGEVELMRGNADEAGRLLDLVIGTRPAARDALFVLAYIDWRRGDAEESRRLLERCRSAQPEMHKPKGTVAEGDVRAVMHEDSTPLQSFVESWDGEPVPEQAFLDLDGYLARSGNRR